MKRFEKGSYVLYGVSGVCLIEDVRREALNRREQGEYYVLKPLYQRGATVLVPTDSQVLTGRMAPLPTPEELTGLLDAARGRTMPWIHDRKERNQAFQQVLKQCELPALLGLVDAVSRRRAALAAEGKKLASADESVLRRAEELVESEMAFVLGLDPRQAAAVLREKLGLEAE